MRGSYLNAIDRLTAAQIANVITSHLRRRFLARPGFGDLKSADSNDSDESSVLAPPELTIVLGFDGRLGSPDIFAGVLSAVRQSGCDVVDAGMSTAAGILHVCRRVPSSAAAFIVTGAGAGSGDVGLDVFLRDGQPVTVPWADYGIVLRRNTTDPEDDLSSDANGIDATLKRIRATADTADITNETEAGLTGQDTFLILPKRKSGFGRFRSGRKSGAVRTFASEPEYRRWLLAWWPQQSRITVWCTVADGLTKSRLEWLAKERDIRLHIEFASSAGDFREAGDVAIEISEDDRFFRVTNARGQLLNADTLANWMNTSGRSTSPHITAHAAPMEDRLLLIDIAAPNSGMQHHVISDSLASLGFLLQLLQDGRNPLPSF